MSEHPLHDLHVGPGADGERCCCVSEVMGRDPTKFGIGRHTALHRPSEPATPRVTRPQELAVIGFPQILPGLPQIIAAMSPEWSTRDLNTIMSTVFKRLGAADNMTPMGWLLSGRDVDAVIEILKTYSAEP